MVNKKDLFFISREFENFDIPKDKLYLLKYFRNALQVAFLKYYFVFDNFDNFVDHTGFYCENRWLKILENRLFKLEEVYKTSKKNFDFETVLDLEKGRYKLK